MFWKATFLGVMPERPFPALENRSGAAVQPDTWLRDLGKAWEGGVDLGGCLSLLALRYFC